MRGLLSPPISFYGVAFYFVAGYRVFFDCVGFAGVSAYMGFTFFTGHK